MSTSYEQQQVWLAVRRLAKDTEKLLYLRLHNAYSEFLRGLKPESMPTPTAVGLMTRVHAKLAAKYIGGNPINRLSEMECEQLACDICDIFAEFISLRSSHQV